MKEEDTNGQRAGASGINLQPDVGIGDGISLLVPRANNLGVAPIPVSGTEAQVCQDIAQRQQFGINKYGQTVADNPLNLYQWMLHAYEESLDFSVYMKRAMAEIAKTQSFTVTCIKHLSGEVLLTTDFDEKVGEHLAAGDQVVLLVLKKGA